MPDRLQRRLVEIGAPADVFALAAELAEQAVRDPLTGLYNRRFFDEALAQNIESARRYNRPLSLVLFDLDDLKKINDTGGHQSGDAVLKTFAQLLQKTARKADIVCRIGGDEFAVILPETGFSKVQTRAQRERPRECRAVIKGSGSFVDRFFQCLENSGINAAAGAAALPSENLFAAADSELFEAKRIARRARGRGVKI